VEEACFLSGAPYNLVEELALLRVAVLKGDPRRTDLQINLPTQHAQVLQEGSRLRECLPVYLAQRIIHVEEHCLLIAPLQALVSA
jgi:hypothetical protein